jgi:hypothetical protein
MGMAGIVIGQKTLQSAFEIPPTAKAATSQKAAM